MDRPESTFTLIKTTNYHNMDKKLDKHIQCLEHLSKAEFDYVRIPSFTFTLQDKTLTVTQEFIKGLFVGRRHEEKLYKGLVLRESEWTFNDFNITNFIQSQSNGCIYCIDLVSYRKTTKEERQTNWNKLRGEHLSISETGHYLHIR